MGGLMGLKCRKVMIVFGTRPEAVKMGPVVKALRRKRNIETIVVVTGQHREMLDQVLDIFEITPSHDLDIMKKNQTLFELTNQLLVGMERVIQVEKPDLVVVQGDTTTAMGAALAAYYMQIPVAHVEAGLRTYNIKSPYPEEFNRQAISIISEMDFAPTQFAMDNLLREGKRKETIWVTGNPVIDAMQTTIKPGFHHPLLDLCAGKKIIMLTAHRRENVGEPMRNVFRAIKRVVAEREDICVVYPMHPNPSVRSICDEMFGNSKDIYRIEPLNVIDFHNFLNAAYLVLTDSGGIQEEAPSLGKPVLILRDTTERMEGVEAGTAKLIGTDESNVYREFMRMLDDKDEYNRMSHRSNPYGDGKAAERIAEIIAKRLGVDSYYGEK